MQLQQVRKWSCVLAHIYWISTLLQHPLETYSIKYLHDESVRCIIPADNCHIATVLTTSETELGDKDHNRCVLSFYISAIVVAQLTIHPLPLSYPNLEAVAYSRSENNPSGPKEGGLPG